jgi:hypothetical protein
VQPGTPVYPAIACITGAFEPDALVFRYAADAEYGGECNFVCAIACLKQCGLTLGALRLNVWKRVITNMLTANI